jgi:Rha family phage regulatory protein
MKKTALTKLAFRRKAPHIAVVDGIPTTTSRDIAETFGRRHDTVLRAIQHLECSADFNDRNFAVVTYIDAKGQRRPEYRITRDGFAFLGMGFTGARAAQWKEKYIETFNRMADKLAGRPIRQIPAPRPQIAPPAALPPPAGATTSPERLALAMRGANEIAGSVQSSVFEQLVADGGESWLHERFMLSFNHDRVPHVSKIPRDANVLSIDEFAKALIRSEWGKTATLKIAEAANLSMFGEACRVSVKNDAKRINEELDTLAIADLQEVAKRAWLVLVARAAAEQTRRAQAAGTKQITAS